MNEHRKMHEYVAKPQSHRAMAWDGTHEGAKVIIDYLHGRHNCHAIFRNSPSALKRSLRVMAQGHIFDIMPGQFFVHNLVTDKIFVVPADVFHENFRQTVHSQRNDGDPAP